ncbi:GIY-YIG nuclease family protein [Ornithinimicrobium sp. F0845]|uniref:GIY-YIG nuclease family protein n=1 Tax=Ornithinimicrobium sp. F0845 TaxID=2926412 RepID=UPI001FF446D3|nr:GIY-YIG nuclease family protein [Ornithinimicrobium sp. F0845]MCK0114011.1 GIY-YIG nuclease family protein [Ornithinimicrobium sp. F0845]
MAALDAAHDNEVVPDPPIPPQFGKQIDSALRQKLHQRLLHASGQLGSVYRAMVAHPDAGPTQLLPHTEAANVGAVANRKVVVEAIFEGYEPSGPTVALQAARTVSGLLKAEAEDDVKNHLADVLTRLQARAGNEQAVEAESAELTAQSAELATALEQASGVYVYTYPHYYRHPYIAGTERRMLKVGRTTNKAWGRVISQARQTGMPEDPLLLRVYTTEDPVSVEKTYHMMLDAAGHDRSIGAAVGKEWFVTTLEFCDAIASVLNLEALKGSEEP